jgi:hypothetical protein
VWYNNNISPIEREKEMDREIQNYYEDLLELFASAGWKHFIEDIESNKEILEDINTISDEKQFWFRRGQLEAVQRILGYQEAIVNSYEDFVEASDA